jgi:hypothetical protein
MFVSEVIGSIRVDTGIQCSPQGVYPTLRFVVCPSSTTATPISTSRNQLATSRDTSSQNAIRTGSSNRPHRAGVGSAQLKGPTPQLLLPAGLAHQLQLQLTHFPSFQTLYNFQSLAASLFGVGAGILGLESYNGFLFYIISSLLTTTLFYALRVAPSSLSSGKPMLDTSRYFRGPFEFWTGGLFGGLAGFILTWTLFYGLVRA